MDLTESHLKADSSILDHLPVAALISHIDNGALLYVNAAFCALFGKSPAEWIGQSTVDLYNDPGERQKILQHLREQGSLRNYEVQGRHADGYPFWALLSIDSLTFAGQSGWLGIIHDISERKEAERDLEQQRRILEALLDNMPIGAFMVEVPSGQPIMANKRAGELLGRGVLPDADKNTLAEVYQAYRYGTEEVYPTAEMPIVRTLQGESSYVNDMEVQHPDGSRTLLEVYGSPIYDKEQNIRWGLVTFQDITGRKHAEEERVQLQQEIIDAQKRAIQELSTPIIPVMERIIVMPLIGSIDSMRAKDITRTLLAGIREHRAKVVILDITGVPLVDSGVANHLNKTIQAARLKGARTIITGISDAVAETIVDLGIDWGNLETLTDLQTGLIVALASLGLKLAKA